MNARIFVSLICAVAFSSNVKLHAQEGPCTVPTNTIGKSVVLNPWRKEQNATRKPVPYPYVREADVMWSKRVWRTVDLREKINLPLRYPLEPHPDRKSLFDVLKDGIRCGELTAFGDAAFDDEFRRPLTKTEAEDIFVSIDSVDSENPENGQWDRIAIRNELTSERVVQYWVKEDWFFDKERSVLDVRVLGICPLVEKLNEAGDVVGVKPLFWIYYPEARPVLARWEVYLGQNNSLPITFDDLFYKRIFSGYVTKEDNVYDRRIAEFSEGSDALYEGEKVKTGISDFESDLWHY